MNIEDAEETAAGLVSPVPAQSPTQLPPSQQLQRRLSAATSPAYIVDSKDDAAVMRQPDDKQAHSAPDPDSQSRTAPVATRSKRKYSNTDGTGRSPRPSTYTRQTTASGSSQAAHLKQRRALGKYIKAGDLVIIFISRDRPFSPLTATPDQNFTNAFGTFPHNNIIGRPFGSQIRSSNDKGFLTLLRPTPELWTLSLPHRTQILYGPDMSFISMKMALGPGSRVVEAGTGSGSFTHFLARCVGLPNQAKAEECQTMGRGWKGQEGWGISTGRSKGVQTRPPKEKSESEEGTPDPRAPSQDIATITSVQSNGDSHAEQISSQTRRIQHQKTLASATPDFDGDLSAANGKVWTFEFHGNRAALSRQEFLDHALTPLVSTSHRNVCSYGFPSSIDGLADAVFLDLPAPWEAIPFAPSVLNPKTQGTICCFSPCIEQVLRTVKALGVAGFQDVETFESLVRTHESIKSGFAGAGTAGGLFDMPLRDIGDIKESLKERVRKRERMSENQRKKAREKKERRTRLNEGKGDNAEKKAQAGSDDDEGGEEGEEEEEEEEEEEGEEGEEEEGKKEVDDAEERIGNAKRDEDHTAVPQSVPASAADRSEAQAPSSSATTKSATATLANTVSESKAASIKATNSSGDARDKVSFPPPSPSTHPLPSHFGQGKEYKQQVVRSNTYSRLHASMRGHTSYLTFGRLPPRSG